MTTKMEKTYGVTATKAKRNAVLNQLIALSDTEKNSDAVVETAENVNHLCWISKMNVSREFGGETIHPS